jgi:succinyl-CoA synthetase alpha subunit
VQLGWGVREHGGQTVFLLPVASSVREVVSAFEGVDISAVSVGPVTLEHAYLELLEGERC